MDHHNGNRGSQRADGNSFHRSNCLNSSLTNIIKNPLGNIFDVNGEPVVECNPDDQNCIKKFGFCLFQNKICCDDCTCFGLCALCRQE
ncbi:hypothetical protein ES332_D09G244900v1 [Gossypium tomentosum]|uniref:Uncharacterized protein n=1 Tax=Gossypium tomentosum TaxID=34277 RepID=A0A5D2JL81_GOSTO|nr:hypothetical protein ES332_D09G244900v1 [Gossypium tomentosum]